MKATPKEQRHAERLLQRNGVRLHEIERFSFMKRYYQKPRKGNLMSKDKYGAGVLTLHLKQGREKAIYLRSYYHPTAVIRYLLSNNIPFDNYLPKEREAGIEIPDKKYCHASLYMLYFISLCLMFFILGYRVLSSGIWWGVIPGIFSFALSIIMLYALLTRFGFLTLDNESITVHSLGRKVRYPYNSLRKVNFDYARERNFTYNMEVLDTDYNYRLYYIGRVPRSKMEEITKHLQQAGIDATCEIERDKRFYGDDYSSH